MQLPYAPHRSRLPEPPPPTRFEAPPPPPPPPVVAPAPEPLPRLEPEPQYERPPVVHSPPLDPVEEALAGRHLVPADIRDKIHHAKAMPWYLKRPTLIGLALLAVVLIALVVSLS